MSRNTQVERDPYSNPLHLNPGGKQWREVALAIEVAWESPEGKYTFEEFLKLAQKINHLCQLIRDMRKLTSAEKSKQLFVTAIFSIIDDHEYMPNKKAEGEGNNLYKIKLMIVQKSKSLNST